MLFAAYALFIGVAVLALLANADEWGRYKGFLLRVLMGSIAGGAGFIALLLLRDGDGDHTTLAVVLLGAMLLGSILYLGGLLLWRGHFAFALRVVGWIGLVIPPLFPSTLSFALPILAFLALTLSAVSSADSARASQPTHVTS